MNPNNSKSWDALPGWYDFAATYERVIRDLPGGILVEVGCYLGRSLCALGQMALVSKKPFQILGVDHCRGSGMENGHDSHGVAVRAGGGSFAAQLLSNVIDCGLRDRVSLLIADSISASRLFTDNSLDFVFLDAAHDYDSVTADIKAWLPKVRIGGIIGGDDYGLPGKDHIPVWPGVRRAVEECLPGFECSPHDCWLYVKKG